MLLTLLVLVPVLTGFACWPLRNRAVLERLNLLAFAVIAALAMWLAAEVLARGTVEAFDGFLRADALSALVVGLTAIVALVCGIYAVGYLREEERAGKINARLAHRYYVLTPVFVGTMMAVPIVNNLGLMWVAIESTTLASVLLVRFYNQKSSLEAAWKYIIIGSAGIALALFGVASILVATPFVLVQRNFRRLLAYSSIDHAGIMVAALGFGGKLGALGAVLHMVFHAVAKPLMFFCAGNVQQHYGTPYLRTVTGVLRTLPWTGGLFLLATIAVTGAPPFGLFQSEFLALSAALAADRPWPAGLFLAGIVAIFAGFLVHLSRLALGEPSHAGAATPTSECPWKLGAMLLVAAPLIAFGLVLPTPLHELAVRAAQIISGVP